MKFFIIILLIHYVSVFGDNFGARITKNQLRGMHKETYEGLLKELFIKSFDSIYDVIIEHAKLGQNEYRFTIMCEEIPNNKCETQNKNGNQIHTVHNGRTNVHSHFTHIFRNSVH